jgi:hypothetical protein
MRAQSIAALRAHADDANVAVNGCCALVSIAFTPAGEEAIIAAGGRAAITAAKRHAKVHVFADRALALLV